MAWLLVSLPLLMVVGVTGAGQAGRAQPMDRVRAESAERTAVLLEPAEVLLPAADGVSTTLLNAFWC